MIKNRRDFLKLAGVAGIGLTNPVLLKGSSYQQEKRKSGIVAIDHKEVRLEDSSTLSIPYWRIESAHEGPSLAMIASQHGNEVQGAEIALRFMEICEKELVSGTVWLVPMANLLAVRSRKHSFNLGPEENNVLNPEKLHNLQRHWPGDPEGNDTARIAYALDQAVLKNCSHLVDIHNWSQFTAAETLSEEEHESSGKMSEVTTTRFISYRNTVAPDSEKMMISQMIRKRGGSVVVMELSGQFQMKERQIQTGLSSMVNIAKVLGMIDGQPELINGKRAVRNADTNHEIKAPVPGIFMPAPGKNKLTTIMPEDFVEKGESLGHIIRVNDLTTTNIIAPVSGYLGQLGACHWGLCDASLPAQHPYIEEGEIMARIVTV